MDKNKGLSERSWAKKRGLHGEYKQGTEATAKDKNNTRDRYSGHNKAN